MTWSLMTGSGNDVVNLLGEGVGRLSSANNAGATKTANITIDVGDGDDTLIINSYYGFQTNFNKATDSATTTISLGSGADSLTIGHAAHFGVVTLTNGATATRTIDLGANDDAQDVVTFLPHFRDFTFTNFNDASDAGTDDKFDLSGTGISSGNFTITQSGADVVVASTATIFGGEPQLRFTVEDASVADVTSALMF